MEQSIERDLYHSDLPKKAEIINDEHGHQFDIGEEVTLTKLYRKGKHDEYYRAVSEDDLTWYVHKDEIKLI